GQRGVRGGLFPGHAGPGSCGGPAGAPMAARNAGCGAGRRRRVGRGLAGPGTLRSGRAGAGLHGPDDGL
ncbi:MAG: hypothetical protein AVDCRST_MAG15-1306, partial [uncultured Rubellimicrobium sp.]